MILRAHNNIKTAVAYGARRQKMARAKRTIDKSAKTTVKAYNAGDKRFDPLGSYTGRGGKDGPCQDADDL